MTREEAERISDLERENERLRYELTVCSHRCEAAESWRDSVIAEATRYMERDAPSLLVADGKMYVDHLRYQEVLVLLAQVRGAVTVMSKALGLTREATASSAAASTPKSG